MGARRKLKWWIAGGIVIAAVIVFAVSARGPSGPLFLVRVIHFTPGDTNVVFGITNNSGSRIDCWINVNLDNPAKRSHTNHTVAAHTFDEFVVSIADTKESPPDVFIIGYRAVKNMSLRRRLIQWGRVIGVDEFLIPVHFYVQFSLTNTTGWLNPDQLDGVKWR